MCNNRSPPLRRRDCGGRKISAFRRLCQLNWSLLPLAARLSARANHPVRFGPLLYLLVALVSATVPAVSQSGTQTQPSMVFVILKVGTISLQLRNR